jgi:hypothetical protein
MEHKIRACAYPALPLNVTSKYLSIVLLFYQMFSNTCMANSACAHKSKGSIASNAPRQLNVGTVHARVLRIASLLAVNKPQC